jgi:hypothetical protein
VTQCVVGNKRSTAPSPRLRRSALPRQHQASRGRLETDPQRPLSLAAALCTGPVRGAAGSGKGGDRKRNLNAPSRWRRRFALGQRGARQHLRRRGRLETESQRPPPVGGGALHWASAGRGSICGGEGGWKRTLNAPSRWRRRFALGQCGARQDRARGRPETESQRTFPPAAAICIASPKSPTSMQCMAASGDAGVAGNGILMATPFARAERREAIWQ